MEKVKAGFVDSRKLLEEMKNAEPFVVKVQARGGKERYALDRCKEIMKNGGHVLMANNKGFLEMKDELLMDSNETVSEMLAKEVDKRILEKVEAGEMHIKLQNAAEEIHKNAVAHGWWEGERDTSEVKALIHSEWSEALEEARAGRPMEWYACKHGDRICDPDLNCQLNVYRVEECPLRIAKPEGIAVELIDGVIRILDFMAYKFADEQEEWDNFSSYLKSAQEEVRFKYGVDVRKIKEYKLIEILHDYTSLAKEGTYSCCFGSAVGAVFEWIRAQGLSPEAIMLRKHEYNVTRPYKHGKKF